MGKLLDLAGTGVCIWFALAVNQLDTLLIDFSTLPYSVNAFLQIAALATAIYLIIRGVLI